MKPDSRSTLPKLRHRVWTSLFSVLLFVTSHSSAAERNGDTPQLQNDPLVIEGRPEAPIIENNRVEIPDPQILLKSDPETAPEPFANILLQDLDLMFLLYEEEFQIDAHALALEMENLAP